MLKPKLSAIALLLVMLCGISACKKDKDDTPSLSAKGAWRPAESTESLKYVVISEDGYQYMLEEQVLGLRYAGNYVYTASDEQIYLRGGYFNDGGYFKYKVSNDSLYLEAPGFYKVLLRETSPPDVNTWVTKIDMTAQYSLPFIGNYGPLEWDGTDFILQSGYIARRFYKYSTSTQQTYDSIDIVNQSMGFCYHQGDIWVNNYQNDDMLHRLNFNTGAYSFNSVVNSSKVLLPSSDGNKIWVFGNNNKIYSYNPSTNSFAEEGEFPEPFLLAFSGAGGFGVDMAIKDGFAYWALGDRIGKLSLSTFRFVETYEITNGGIAGIAYDGTNFWGSGGTSLSNLSISKLNLP